MKRSRGNILFLILLAVVLFAALAYAVTSSMRGGGRDSSQESAEMVAATIMQIQANMTFGLQRFLLTSGYSLEQIDMFMPNLTQGGDSGNTSACTANACNLHHPEGGNVPVPVLPRSAWMGSTPCCTSYINPATGELKPQYMIASVKNVGTPLPEILAYYSLIKPEVCTAINVASGVLQKGQANNIGFSLGVVDTDYVNFSGGNTSPLPVTTPDQFGGAGVIDNRIWGRTAFGMTSGDGKRCTLVLVLLER